MRLLIVDDHRAVAEALALALHPAHDIVGIIFEGSEVLPWLDSHVADTVLIDTTLPHWDALDTIRRIRRTHKRVAVVAVSMFPGGVDWPALHRSGAHALVSKSQPLEEIRTLIRSVSYKTRPQLDEHPRDTLLAPTPRQVNILHGIARGLSHKRIAVEENLSQARVDEHVAELKHRLCAASCAELVLRGVEEGWLEPRVPRERPLARAPLRVL